LKGRGPKDGDYFPEFGKKVSINSDADSLYSPLHIPLELPPQKRILWEMETAPFFISFLLGTFGLGYFVYGKRQANWIAMLCGAGLMGFPYFVSNVWIMVAFGLILMALPFVFRDY